MSRRTRGNWSELHEDLLITIAKKLNTVQDFKRFTAVCRTWRSATLDKHQYPLFSKPLFPWLMLAPNKHEEHAAFLSPLENNFSPLENNVCILKLPELRGCQCWGSPFGWLVTHSLQRGLEIHLLNPFSRTRIRLPSKLDVQDSWISLLRVNKAAIVSITEVDNSEKFEYLVFATLGYGNHLIVARDGSDTWITLEKGDHARDVIQCNGVFYTIDMYGCLKYFNMLYLNPFAKWDVDPPNLIRACSNFVLYLVEFDQELHMAARNWSRDTSKTISIQVYKFDRNKREWEELETLGDNVLFIGNNASFALKASEYPGCKPDSIYFTTEMTGEYAKPDNDVGIFNMGTRNIEYLYQGLSSQPVWITPRVNGMNPLHLAKLKLLF